MPFNETVDASAVIVPVASFTPVPFSVKMEPAEASIALSLDQLLLTVSREAFETLNEPSFVELSAAIVRV